ncbi:hypothetical protein QR680_010041 [Steinernema hermaphroditum]|uniref:Uncharacterized protein n=1 Tax=Steinernema hermaphroditum TaxID=289476 RepID=A0AA39M9Y4_9BILA|nr:hypothetical protein QR680_010041 [Steinernema hermaphroditum]
MDDMRLLVGIWYIIIALFLSPPYIRIVYIFLSKKKYRELECYRIMTQIGLVQLTAAPTTFTLGLMQLLGTDPLGLANVFMTIFSACMSVEILLSFALAINRLKVIFEIECLGVVTKILVAFSWLYGLAYVIVVHTPFCGFYQLPGQYIGKYDFQKPYTWLLERIDGTLLLSCVLMTLLVYVMIIAYLFHLRRRSSSLNHIVKERPILVFACVHFCFDMTLQVAFFFGDFPPSDVTDLMVALIYFLNSLLTAPVLYLILTRSLRNDFCKIFVKYLRGSAIGITIVPTSIPQATRS